MVNCAKRQTVVKRPSGEVILRCLNRKCEAFGTSVRDETCEACPAKVLKHVAPCAKKPVKAGEATEVTPATPSMSSQAWLWAEAVRKWSAAGRPKRSQEEVDRIHKTHCAPCSWYDAEKKRCKGCGCRVTLGTVAVVNKIKMATEHCPRELW